jgi:hypothetical protein
MSKVKNYEKRGNGRWRKYVTSCATKPYGSISDDNGRCSTPHKFQNAQAPNAIGSVKKLKYPILVQTNTNYGWIKGYHFDAGGIVFNSVLTFN